MNTSTLAPLYVASKNPEAAIEKIAYPGQPANMRRYRKGFENYFNSMPVIDKYDDNIAEDLFVTREVLGHLSEKLQKEQWEIPQDGAFIRTIIALEEPEQISDEHYREGAELIVAHWGVGHTSPVHGHAQGYMHEEILSGKIRVNTYRIVDHGVVRPLETQIVEKGVFVSKYGFEKGRNNLIHNFVAVEPTISLHYVPEHTRDGRDNTFQVEEFGAIAPNQVSRISSKEGLYLNRGDVVLVRSVGVPEYDDHFIVITGHNVMKPQGLRPQERSIMASKSHSKLLDMFPLQTGLSLLKLDDHTKQAFLNFHGIIVKDNEVIFPE